MRGLPQIIAFNGKSRAGKDAACAHIIQERGNQYKITRLAFADAIREEIAGQESELCFRNGIKYEPDNRHKQLLQFYGEQKRASDRFYWIRKLSAKAAQVDAHILLISDMRYPNELSWVKGNRGLTVKIDRLGHRDLSIDYTHVSETALDDIMLDYEIHVAADNLEELHKDALYVFDLIVDSFRVSPEDITNENIRPVVL